MLKPFLAINFHLYSLIMDSPAQNNTFSVYFRAIPPADTPKWEEQHCNINVNLKSIIKKRIQNNLSLFFG